MCGNLNLNTESSIFSYSFLVEIGMAGTVSNSSDARIDQISAI